MADPLVVGPAAVYAGGGECPAERPVFYYDLASPECWLAAERINSALPEVPVWQPVHLPAVLAATGVTGQEDAFEVDSFERRAAVEHAALEQGLLPVHWPDPFPADSALATRAAVFAQASGRAVAFSLAAFRQAFAAGRDLGDPDNVIIAAAACELHPRAVLKGIETRSVRERLEAACVDAAAAGVRSVPAVSAAGTLFEGAEVVERAAAVLGGSPARL